MRSLAPPLGLAHNDKCSVVCSSVCVHTQWSWLAAAMLTTGRCVRVRVGAVCGVRNTCEVTRASCVPPPTTHHHHPPNTIVRVACTPSTPPGRLSHTYAPPPLTHPRARARAQPHPACRWQVTMPPHQSQGRQACCLQTWCVGECVRACVAVCVAACMRVCLRTCVRACLAACVLACVRAWLRGCVAAWLRGCVAAWLHACVH